MFSLHNWDFFSATGDAEGGPQFLRSENCGVGRSGRTRSPLKKINVSLLSIVEMPTLSELC